MLLVDTAIVGHLGTTSLAGLAIAATVLQTVVGLCVFLAYGTTASVGRHLGAGDLRGAMATGMNGIWLALVLGGAAAFACSAGAPAITSWFGPSAPVASAAVSYLAVAALGIPAMLVVLAATGVLRGLQDLRTPLVVMIVANVLNAVLSMLLVYGAGLGLVGAAIGTTIAQLAAAAYLALVVVRGARAHHADLRPHRAGIAEAARAGSALVLRTLTLRAALLIAILVATSQGDAALAAQQIAVTLVSTLAFALDAIAIAGQALTSRSLGADDIAGTRATTRRMIGWGLVSGVVAAALLLALHTVLPSWFSSDEAVRDALVPALIVVALIQPASGIVFVLDGVLIGAGDGAYLAKAGVVVLVAYAPLALLVAVTGAGLAWLWVAYGGFILARMATLMLRERSDAWLVTGASKAR